MSESDPLIYELETENVRLHQLCQQAAQSELKAWARVKELEAERVRRAERAAGEFKLLVDAETKIKNLEAHIERMRKGHL